MDERLKTLRNICSWAGIVSLFIYMVLTILGNGDVLKVVSIIVAAIGLIAFAIKCGVEVASEENFGGSIFLMSICLIDIVLNGIQIILF